MGEVRLSKNVGGWTNLFLFPFELSRISIGRHKLVAAVEFNDCLLSGLLSILNPL